MSNFSYLAIFFFNYICETCNSTTFFISLDDRESLFCMISLWICTKELTELRIVVVDFFKLSVDLFYFNLFILFFLCLSLFIIIKLLYNISSSPIFLIHVINQKLLGIFICLIIINIFIYFNFQILTKF